MFAEMSSNRKFLYLMGIITIVVGAAYVLLGLYVLLTGAVDDDILAAYTAAGMDTAIAATLSGGFLIVAGLIQALVGFLGVRGAKQPRKVLPYLVLVIIDMIFCLISFIQVCLNGSMQASDITLLLPVALVIAAWGVHQEAKDR